MVGTGGRDGGAPQRRARSAASRAAAGPGRGRYSRPGECRRRHACHRRAASAAAPGGPARRFTRPADRREREG
jgi:hypothetical protein